MTVNTLYLAILIGYKIHTTQKKSNILADNRRIDTRNLPLTKNFLNFKA